MNFEEFRHEILLGLGGGLVDVEFECEEHNLQFDSHNSIKYALNKAIRTWQQKGNHNLNKAFALMEVEKGKRVYDLPPPEQGKIDTIVKIIRPERGWSVDNPFHVMAYNEMFQYPTTGGCKGSSTNWVMYEMTLQALDDAKRYTAYDMQFIHQKHKNTIELLKEPDANGKWFLECYKELELEEYMDVLWVQDYTLAIAKELLGTAYRKLQSVAGPTGEVSLSGDQLVSEAKEEKRELMEQIQQGTDGDAVFYEVRFG